MQTRRHHAPGHGFYECDLGLHDSARDALSSSVGSSLPTAVHYLERAEIFNFLNKTDLAVSDSNDAARINPNQTEYAAYIDPYLTENKCNDSD